MELSRLERLSAVGRFGGDRPAGMPATILLFAIAAIAALYFGKPVFVPLAIAFLLGFVLTPVITWLRKHWLPRIASVLLAVTLLFAAVVAIGALMAQQITVLVEELPRYERTLMGKVKAVRGVTGGSNAVTNASKTLKSLGKELEKPANGSGGSGSSPAAVSSRTVAPKEVKPVPVVVKEERRVLDAIQRIVGVLIEPLATTGIVFVFLSFILLQREDVRDRVIRLFGSSDLERTTAAMDDAAGRLSRFLLTQTVLNAGYGAVIGVALWFIGVPSPVLWGVLAFLMRFVPFIGSFIAAGFPVILAAAIDPTWTSFWLTLSLYLVGEPLMGHAVEPYIQGQTTGLSPLAIVVSASFWTLLWGPIGLMLAVPLTACLVILGKHVKQLEFLHVILGDAPALEPDQKFYQRALAGAGDEMTEDAELLLKKMSMASYCDAVALAGLKLAQSDAERDVLTSGRRELMLATVEELLENLSEFDSGVNDPPEATDDGSTDGANGESGSHHDAELGPIALRGEWQGQDVVTIIPAKTAIDEAAANVLMRVLVGHGVGARVISHSQTSSAALNGLDFSATRMIIVSSLSGADASSTVRFLLRRLRRVCPDATTMTAAFWGAEVSAEQHCELRRKLECDGVVASCKDALAHIREMASGSSARRAGSGTCRALAAAG
jgi:predicted PurR-regulated permease PerM